MLFFVSYSRQQFYFAEALVRVLKSQGHPIWFDVHELVLGGDWRANLDAGLEQSTGVILIASRAALKSPYVEREWRHAMAMGKPVFCILFEPVRLPTDLSSYAQALIPHGSNFDPLLFALRDYRRDRPGVHKMPYQPHWYHHLTWLEFDVLFVWLTLVASAGYHLMGALWVAWPGMVSRTTLQIVFVTIAAYYVWLAWRFLTRNFDVSSLQYTLITFNLVGIVSYTQLIAGDRGVSVHLIMYPAALVMLCLTLVSALLLRRSYHVLRWLPTGEASIDLRRHFYGFLQQSKTRRMVRIGPLVVAHPSGRMVRLDYHPYDRVVAQQIERQLHQHGHRVDANQPEFHLVLISNFTDRRWLAAFLSAHPVFIPILIAPVELPPELADLSRYQWIDYRTQSSVQLQGLMDFLNGADQALVAQKTNNVPESMNRVVMPMLLEIVALALRLLTGIGLILSLVLGLAVLLRLPNASLLAGPAILCSLLLLWILARVEQRLASLLLFGTLLILTVVVYWLTFGRTPLLSPLIVVLLIIGLVAASSTNLELDSLNTWFPATDLFVRRAPDAFGKRQWGHAANLTLVALLFGIWASIHLPAYNVAGMLEMAVFQLGWTGYTTVQPDEHTTFQAPNYFQEGASETPDFLAELGSAVWSAESATGMSRESALNIQLLRYAPRSIWEVDAMVPLDVRITGTAIPVNLPNTDPASGLRYMIDQEFRTLAEQRYPQLLPKRILPTFNAVNGRTQLIPGRLEYDPVMVFRSDLPYTYVTHRAALIDEDILLVSLPNTEVVRFRLDLQSTHFRFDPPTEENHHLWLISVNTTGPDFILSMEGSEAVLRWHEPEVIHLLDSLTIDPSQLRPFAETIQAGPWSFVVPTEHSSTAYLSAHRLYLFGASYLLPDNELYGNIARIQIKDSATSLWEATFKTADGEYAMAVLQFTGSSEVPQVDDLMQTIKAVVHENQRLHLSTLTDAARSTDQDQRAQLIVKRMYLPTYEVIGDTLIKTTSGISVRLVTISSLPGSLGVGQAVTTILEHFLILEREGIPYIIWIGMDKSYADNHPTFVTDFLDELIWQEP